VTPSDTADERRAVVGRRALADCFSDREDRAVGGGSTAGGWLTAGSLPDAADCGSDSGGELRLQPTSAAAMNRQRLACM
jgi:hypothetical protein